MYDEQSTRSNVYTAGISVNIDVNIMYTGCFIVSTSWQTDQNDMLYLIDN